MEGDEGLKRDLQVVKRIGEGRKKVSCVGKDSKWWDGHHVLLNRCFPACAMYI